MRLINKAAATMIVASMLISGQAFADKKQAESFVSELTSKTITVMKSKEPYEVKDKKLRKLFLSSVDLPWISRFVLGKYWRSTDDRTRKRYQDAYEEYIAYTYLPHFMEYRGQKIHIEKTLKIDKNSYSVNTIITQTDYPSLPINYLLHTTKDGQLKVYDLNVEGSSMITTQRDDFGSVIARKGLVSFIDRLEAIVKPQKQAQR